VGTNVQAKYSGDGQFYDAVVEDFQNGHYSVNFTEYSEQAWVLPSDVKK